MRSLGSAQGVGGCVRRGVRRAATAAEPAGGRWGSPRAEKWGSETGDIAAQSLPRCGDLSISHLPTLQLHHL